MFCSQCGNKLNGDETFCGQCGNRVDADIQALKAAEAAAAAQAAADVAVEEPTAAAEEPAVVAQEPAADVAVEEAAEPAEEPVAAASAEPAAPAAPTETPSAPAAPVVPPVAAEPANPLPFATDYVTPVTPVQKPKKKKKTGLLLAILIPVLVVVLIGSIVTGVLLTAKSNYEQAMVCVDNKNYEEALMLLDKCTFYKDSEEMIAYLEQQQSDYNDALTLLDANNYAEAKAILSSLGDYRDSRELLETSVPYRQASYLMDSAAQSENDGIVLYEEAAAIFQTLGVYEDSADKYSLCYRQIATLYMEQSLFDEALACREKMNETDAEAVFAEYMTYCADEAFLADLEASLRTRLDMEEAYYDDPDMTDLDLVEAEWEYLSKYAEEGVMFYDEDLELAAATYIGGLVIEASVIEDDEFFYDYATWYTGNAARYLAVETLISDYGFLDSDPELQASFEGLAELYAAAAVIEQDLTDQLIGVYGEYSEEYGDYLVFENTTGYEFDLVVTNEFCDADYETVFYHETDTIHVDIDATVIIPIQFPDTDNWENWYTEWYYDIVIPEDT